MRTYQKKWWLTPQIKLNDDTIVEVHCFINTNHSCDKEDIPKKINGTATCRLENGVWYGNFKSDLGNDFVVYVNNYVKSFGPRIDKRNYFEDGCKTCVKDIPEFTFNLDKCLYDDFTYAEVLFDGFTSLNDRVKSGDSNAILIKDLMSELDAFIKYDDENSKIIQSVLRDKCYKLACQIIAVALMKSPSMSYDYCESLVNNSKYKINRDSLKTMVRSTHEIISKYYGGD